MDEALIGIPESVLSKWIEAFGELTLEEGSAQEKAKNEMSEYLNLTKP